MTIMESLKAKTQPYHEQLEEDMIMMSPGLTKDQYIGVLEKFWGFYRPIESQLEQVNQTTPLMEDFKRRLKGDIIKKDLEALGVSESEINALPLCDGVPVIQDKAQALGTMYVLEGSTLGGQFIAKHIEKLLEITPETGGEFFNPYAGQTGYMWKQFGAYITEETSQLPEEAVVESACKTFNALHHWMSQGK